MSPWARPDSAFNGNHEHIRTHHPERSHRPGPGLGCVAGVRWYGTRPRPLLRATCAHPPGSYPRTVLRPPPGTVPHPAPGTVLRPGREVRPRLAGVILHFRAGRVSLDRLNSLLCVSLCLVTLFEIIGHGIKVVGRARVMLGGAPHHLGLFLLVRSVSRDGCTRFGSPGIFG